MVVVKNLAKNSSVRLQKCVMTGVIFPVYEFEGRFNRIRLCWLLIKIKTKEKSNT